MCRGAKQSITEVEHAVDNHDLLPASTGRVGASQELGPLSALPPSIFAEPSDPSLRTSTMMADANYWIFQGTAGKSESLRGARHLWIVIVTFLTLLT
jgi:hypothetical protein